MIGIYFMKTKKSNAMKKILLLFVLFLILAINSVNCQTVKIDAKQNKIYKNEFEIRHIYTAGNYFGIASHFVNRRFISEKTALISEVSIGLGNYKQNDGSKQNFTNYAIGVGLNIYNRASHNKLYFTSVLKYQNVNINKGIKKDDYLLGAGLGYRIPLSSKAFINGEFVGKYGFKSKDLLGDYKVGIGIKF